MEIRRASSLGVCHVVLWDSGSVSFSPWALFLICEVKGLEFGQEVALLAQTFVHRNLVTGL